MSKSIINESLNEYRAYLNGEPNQVEVNTYTIPQKATLTADSIKVLRKELDTSQTGLANMLGVSTKTINSWENNQSKPRGAARKLLVLLMQNNDLADKLIFM